MQTNKKLTVNSVFNLITDTPLQSSLLAQIIYYWELTWTNHKSRTPFYKSIIGSDSLQSELMLVNTSPITIRRAIKAMAKRRTKNNPSNENEKYLTFWRSSYNTYWLVNELAIKRALKVAILAHIDNPAIIDKLDYFDNEDLSVTQAIDSVFNLPSENDNNTVIVTNQNDNLTTYQNDNLTTNQNDNLTTNQNDKMINKDNKKEKSKHHHNHNGDNGLKVKGDVNNNILIPKTLYNDYLECSKDLGLDKQGAIKLLSEVNTPLKQLERYNTLLSYKGASEQVHNLGPGLIVNKVRIGAKWKQDHKTNGVSTHLDNITNSINNDTMAF